MFPSQTVLWHLDPAHQEESSYYTLISKRVLVALCHQKGETSCLKVEHQTGPQVGFLGSRYLYLSVICYTFNPLIRNLNLDSGTLRKIFLLLISNSFSYRSAFVTRTGLQRDRRSGRQHHQASKS